MTKPHQDSTPTQAEPLPPPFSISDFCAWAGIGRTLLWKLEREGKAPRFCKVGRRRMIRREEAARWLASLES